MENTKDMSFFKKIENFWYYYKWQLIIVAVMVLAAYGLFSTLFQEKEPADVEVLSVYSAFISDNELDFQKNFGDLIEDSDKNGEKVVTHTEQYITTEGDSDDDVIELSKFENNISRAASDLILLDEYNFQRFQAKDYYEDLSLFLDVSKFNEEDVFYRNEKPVAIRLRESKILKEAEFRTDNVYAGIMFIPENAGEELLQKRENAVKILLKLAEQ